MGKITDVVKRNVPASYRAMCGVTNAYFSLDQLQDLSEFVQYRLFSTIVDVVDETTLYNPKERELLGTITTLNFIPAAVDYWGDKLASQTAQGVNESQAYFDRRPDLWKIFAELQEKSYELSAELGVFSKVANLPGVSYGDNDRGVLITEDPTRWPKLRRNLWSDVDLGIDPIIQDWH